ncbi:FAD binding domain-containing protein [Chelatococcus reniformis]|uniref:Oxidoreductase n=1 Tax=Chelatococcus reniformis TaxID=1494448 RepID=A0A916U249_9HYPH|nr:xanthine dehydrogenase family protein subunit M [Chelatococcus reniformis]GGC53907.1 oxidoreductase [Chelatococcus reniformis]
MIRFDYVRPTSVPDAVKALAAKPGAQVIAGGTNLVDLLKYDVAKPSRLIDINRLPLRAIEDTADGGLKLGALVTNADAAYDVRVAQRFPLLASAILAGASAQLRNAATTGGNLLQRTRCLYFYDPHVPCNKREPGTGCPARTGVNRNLAVLGTSEHCIATHPSDMCVALAALNAVVHVTGPAGERQIALSDFHRVPGDRPDLDNTLERGELITAVEVPFSDFGRHYTYLKLRDRLSYAFALVSVAAAVRLDAGRIDELRVALGGVAPKPWRNLEAEGLLAGAAPERRAYEAFADRLLAGAQGFGDNDFKLGLARRAIVRALTQAVAGTPQSQSDKRVA